MKKYYNLYLKELINNLENQKKIGEIERENEDLKRELLKTKRDLNFLTLEFYHD